MASDHVLVIGFGGPTAPEHIRPFLEDVARGTRIPKPRLEEVARHYDRVGGRSPYVEQVTGLAQALATRLEAEPWHLPVFVGMRHGQPSLNGTIADIAGRGLSHGVGVVLAPYRSSHSFDKYVDRVEDAKRAASAGQIVYTYVRPWHDHPLFIRAQADRVQQALDSLLPDERHRVQILFTAHSIPVEMADACRYAQEFKMACRLVMDRVGPIRWSVAYQSRSGPTHQPWLEPDVAHLIRQAKAQGACGALLVPIGFLCDNVEILYDLDIEAREAADGLGIAYWRAGPVIDHPALLEMFVQLIQGRVSAGDPLRAARQENR